ncbi:hypothetical protein [Sulfitobacter sp. R18_1]|uniref:hypothetical protein n=1 Tax=Sulfitobacter sp. R18_1 TaxID=2821104 RepID=UPI001ADC3EF4|nr:hypothetical protein [Sulfitobacter sp. R18_1]MBO9428799.1 hypothetical protein [Sulfitobacter sp. R18_1]
MLKNMKPFSKLDLKLFLYVFLACALGPLWLFVSTHDDFDQNLITVLAVVTVANFSLDARGPGILTTALVIILGLAGDFFGLIVASFLVVAEVTWMHGFAVEIVLILIFVQLLGGLLRMKDRYEKELLRVDPEP